MHGKRAEHTEMAAQGDIAPVGSLLREVARLHVALQQERIAGCGVTPTQCRLLTALGHDGPLSLAALGRRVGLDKGWVSRAAVLLERRGLVARSGAADDRRLVLLQLTAAGERQYRALDEQLGHLAGQVIAHIHEGDRVAVRTALERLHRALAAEASMPTGQCTDQGDRR